jgi:hypothetical protein
MNPLNMVKLLSNERKETYINTKNPPFPHLIMYSLFHMWQIVAVVRSEKRCRRCILSLMYSPQQLGTGVACQILGLCPQIGRIQLAQNSMTTSLCRSHNTSSLVNGFEFTEIFDFQYHYSVCPLPC